MQESIDEFNELKTTIIAFSPNLPKFAQATADKMHLTFPVLADDHNLVAEQYGLKYTKVGAAVESLRDWLKGELEVYNGYPGWELPVPATYVIDREGIIRWAYANENHRKRPTAKKLLGVLRSISST